jgi:hypothetical protein
VSDDSKVPRTVSMSASGPSTPMFREACPSGRIIAITDQHIQCPPQDADGFLYLQPPSFRTVHVPREGLELFRLRGRSCSCLASRIREREQRDVASDSFDGSDSLADVSLGYVSLGSSSAEQQFLAGGSVRSTLPK